LSLAFTWNLPGTGSYPWKHPVQTTSCNSFHGLSIFSALWERCLVNRLESRVQGFFSSAIFGRLSPGGAVPSIVRWLGLPNGYLVVPPKWLPCGNPVHFSSHSAAHTVTTFTIPTLVCQAYTVSIDIYILYSIFMYCTSQMCTVLLV
jgi:hypothetical protein